ncbi:MAG: hypothetical protein OEO17_16105, partial [Gemmatimonadota bacterium]|nr:hypothetical protein [Gemmatimonadota bacterium]
MLQRSPWALLTVTTLALPSCTPDPATHITADGIMADVSVLAADSMEGRGAGTPGEARAVAYITRRFEQIGLAPAGDSYLLPIELVGLRKNVTTSSLSIRGPRGALPLANDQ